jgi:superfamily I DNA/RNA helicase
MRKNQVRIAPGYDGEFGTICLFTEEERRHLFMQKTLFAVPSKGRRKAQAESTQQSLFKQRKSPAQQERPSPLRRYDTTEPFSTRQRLEELNEAQQEAVRHAGGPLLIEAGPGTGKTRTLTHRIGYLLSKGIARPEQVLAVTFTNKASQEMAKRLGQLTDDSKAMSILTIKTFHALCFDIICLEAEASKMTETVSILNEADRKDLVKIAIQQAGGSLSALRGNRDKIVHLISLAKQLMLSPEDDLALALREAGRGDGGASERLSSQFPSIYKAYQQVLSKNHLLDFDDLIFKTVRLFETNEGVLKRYKQRFSFVSVDEYQDINHAQYRLIRLLAPPNHDICVIGDPNQAIYGFRGADIRYFHRFCEDYPGAKRISLNQNYRSAETILQASGQVMGVDGSNIGEEGIWSGIHGAKALTIAQVPTERAEAEYIIKTIEKEIGGISHFSVDSGRVDSAQDNKEHSFSDFAVLYRVKEQAKPLAEAFARSGIPFQIVGNEKLENRKGISELIAYLRVGLLLASDFDVDRILDFPSRGISLGAVKALNKWCQITGNSLLTALGHAGEISGLNPRARSSLKSFSEDLRKLRECLKGRNVYEQIELILDKMKIKDEMSYDEAFERDLADLLSISRTYADRPSQFLAHLALENEQDLYDPRAERVALMTMHASKGLEFPVLFITGCEDGLIPYRKKKHDGENLAEERRLFYVALTRAQEKVFLTHADERLWYGQKTRQRLSPFVEAIEEDLKHYKKSPRRRPAATKDDRQLKLFSG